MKILNYEERSDGMLVITTDFAQMPVFVYEVDRFKNFEALMREMMKKAESVTIQKQASDARMVEMKTDLDARVVKDAGR